MLLFIMLFLAAYLAVIVIVSLAVLVGGHMLFKRLEPAFAESF